MSKIVKLVGEQLELIKPFYKGVTDTVVYSCFDGQMGEAYVDDIEAPTCAKIITGDFAFCAGDYTSQGARELACYIPESYSRDFLIVIPHEEGWGTLLEEIYGDKCKKFSRYGIHSDATFDEELLKGYIAKLPMEYTLKRFDHDLYHEALEGEWSKDFVVNFLSVEDYLERGMGFGIIHEGKLVAGASSYTMYNEGIEIEIVTKKEYRRKGLALICASALILACLEEGKYPSWDAANMGSVKLAEKLGYRYRGAYDTYGISLGSNL